eukprot:GHRR01032864.1.p1 GENE.GHRR01032864.1~~GHRR01032864.1.p1  ORF type:complete len:252 (+),score=57.93 GHRR01032864.1:312-1067(+)
MACNLRVSSTRLHYGLRLIHSYLPLSCQDVRVMLRPDSSHCFCNTPSVVFCVVAAILQDTYEQLMKQLQDLPNQMTVREYGRNMAQAGAITLMTGRLAAVLAEGVKAAFIPDVASQHLEQAKTLLVPIVVLADHPISVEAQASQRQDDYWGINVTQIEAALAHLLGEGQEAVVITTQHELHRHKQLAAALHKATRCRCEAVVDVPQGWDYSGTDMGLHVNSHTFIDPEALLEEVEKSADFLTHGLVSEYPV